MTFKLGEKVYYKLDINPVTYFVIGTVNLIDETIRIALANDTTIVRLANPKYITSFNKDEEISLDRMNYILDLREKCLKKYPDSLRTETIFGLKLVNYSICHDCTHFGAAGICLFTINNKVPFWLKDITKGVEEVKSCDAFNQRQKPMYTLDEETKENTKC